MNEDIKKAINVIKNGGIIIFPTDTAFGIGCRIDDKKAVRRLFEIRKRPPTQAMPVLVDSLEMAKHYTKNIPKEVVEKLINPYWPGALTIVLPCDTDKVPELVRGNGNNIGLRVPNHPVILEIVKGVGVPILGPSANFHGEKTPYSFSDLNPKLISLVDDVFNGETNNLKKASTVIDAAEKPWRVIREGSIKYE